MTAQAASRHAALPEATATVADIETAQRKAPAAPAKEAEPQNGFVTPGFRKTALVRGIVSFRRFGCFAGREAPLRQCCCGPFQA
jgi:hypothetical protein